MTRRDLQQLAEKRLKEAHSLSRSRLYEGAYHLAGLSIECAVKACIAKQTRRFDFPEKARVIKSYDHNTSELVKVAGLQADLESRMNSSQAFAINWRVVTKWQVDSRYHVKVSKQDADELLVGITHPAEGVWTWLHSHW